jgi:DNA processing protein
MIGNLDDLEYFMSWQPEVDKHPVVEPRLFMELTPEEQRIVDAIGGKEVSVDEICQTVAMPAGWVSSLLLGLEFNGVVVSLPGKMYKLK